MKAKDLRIGNYIRLKDCERIYSAAVITPRKIGFHHGNDKSRIYYRKYCEIEPVKIREVHDLLPNIPQLLWVDKPLCDDLYYYSGVVITDLHELQNLHHALTGNEIDIEL